MEKRLSSFFLIIIFITNCSLKSQDSAQKINLEEFTISDLPIFEEVEYLNGKGYYRYIALSRFTGMFGQPDQIISRMDELMETEILRLIYGQSYLEFFDHSFTGNLGRENYSLYSIRFEDDKFWVGDKDKSFEVGDRRPSDAEKAEDQQIYLLNRGKLTELSDYVMTIEFENDEIKSIRATFD
jgi:hypothetical protein